MIIWFLYYVVLLALAVAFVFNLLQKWQIWERLQVNAPNKFIWALLTCEFCRCWWLSVIGAAIMALICEPYCIFIPFFSTPLAQKLL